MCYMPLAIEIEPDVTCRLPLEPLVQGTKLCTAHMGNALYTPSF